MLKRTTFVALLRGINVGGNSLILMKPLAALCGLLGWTEIRTLLQSGNIVFNAAGPTAALESEIERAIQKEFGFPVSVIVREAATFRAYAAKVPFTGETVSDPGRLILYVPKQTPRADAAAVLASRAIAGEKAVVVGDVLWIYFPKGAGTSKLTPTVIDRAVGSSATGRNWNTVTKIQQLCTENGVTGLACPVL